LGVTGGRFLSTSTTAHPTCLLRQPSWIWFPSIIWRTPASTDPIFWWLIGGNQSSPCSTSPKTLSSIHPQTTSHSVTYATPWVVLLFLFLPPTIDFWQIRSLFKKTKFLESWIVERRGRMVRTSGDSQPEGRGFESRRRHGVVSVSRIP
jgi:hypothetical protein